MILNTIECLVKKKLSEKEEKLLIEVTLTGFGLRQDGGLSSCCRGTFALFSYRRHDRASEKTWISHLSSGLTPECNFALK